MESHALPASMIPMQFFGILADSMNPRYDHGPRLEKFHKTSKIIINSGHLCFLLEVWKLIVYLEFTLLLQTPSFGMDKFRLVKRCS